MRQANGGSSDEHGDVAQRLGRRGPSSCFDAWMLAYKADTSNDPQRAKMLRAKPTDAVDGCFDKSTPPQFIADALPFTQQAGVEVQRAVSGVLERRARKPADRWRRTS